MSGNNVYERYQRQLILKGFGEKAQQRLCDARVLVVGGGGLGCPVLQYLCAAGAGCIGIVDDDVVSLSNLHRQVLYGFEDIGKSKAICAAERLKKLNPLIHVIPFEERLTALNTLDIFSRFDIVIDGSDNFETRYLVNDACVLLDKPLIYGAVSEYEGQMAVWNVPVSGGTRSANYRDLFPEPPDAFAVPNCNEAGVLGVLPAMIGCMMAGEAIKWITGIGVLSVNCILNYQFLSQQFHEIAIEPLQAPRNLVPRDAAAFQQRHYEATCPALQEITPFEFDQLLATENVQVIDVREPGETPVVTAFQYQSVPVSRINKVMIREAGEVVVFCQSGQRSTAAVGLLKRKFGTACRIRSLKGGILAWLQEPENNING
ncbi:HesA/MoeB/ThiF family protein [Niabella beijingensis]|uniref:HesA/MoeB/ThiF family protein n=1 Tax=Niabella beijingensis TaxID=2872700 RepID=UPI001CBD1D5A|nr:HesA/MoeB/ThiF family protein [Niabella beijingensis]MBZ4191344.1 HesA/MoeB/ThiF family protein [Niabella beijingensis]